MRAPVHDEQGMEDIILLNIPGMNGTHNCIQGIRYIQNIRGRKAMKKIYFGTASHSPSIFLCNALVLSLETTYGYCTVFVLYMY